MKLKRIRNIRGKHHEKNVDCLLFLVQWQYQKACRRNTADHRSSIVRIDTKTPYTGGYDAVVAQGQEEVQRGYEPPIKDLGIRLEDYDVIAIGTPTWWYTMAPAVKTFIHQQQWQGKYVIPFMTNGGWPGHVIADMKKACRGASIVYPMEIQFDSTGGSRQETPQQDVTAWLEQLRQFAEA